MTPTKNVRRGGGWNHVAPSWMRPASRDTSVPERRHYNIGFRTSLPHRQPIAHTKGLAP
jgi:formylglycine-generating enzyme required for sulfatase activity